MTSTFETLDGTPPQVDAPHEARTLRHTRNDGVITMMSEIADGQFVAWAYCARCHDGVMHCRCANGPVEPEFIGRWRTERFEPSVSDRLNPPEKDLDARPLSSPIQTRALPSGKKAVTAAIDNAIDAVRAAKAARDEREAQENEEQQ